MQDQYDLNGDQLLALAPGDRVGIGAAGDAYNGKVERVTTTQLAVRRDGMSYVSMFNRTGPRAGAERGSSKWSRLTRPDTPPIMRRIALRAVARLGADADKLVRDTMRGGAKMSELREVVETIEKWAALAAADITRAEAAS